MNLLFEISPNDVPNESVQNMLNVIVEGRGEDDVDKEVRVYCIEIYIKMLQEKDIIDDKLIQVIAWVIGEYGFLIEKYSPKQLIDILTDMSERKLKSKKKIKER
jgi:AP-4 complex subunit epsilon-1